MAAISKKEMNNALHNGIYPFSSPNRDGAGAI
jgi:hypothetical protein